MSRSTALTVTLASVLTFSGCGNRPSYNSLSQKETSTNIDGIYRPAVIMNAENGPYLPLTYSDVLVENGQIQHRVMNPDSPDEMQTTTLGNYSRHKNQKEKNTAAFDLDSPGKIQETATDPSASTFMDWFQAGGTIRLVPAGSNLVATFARGDKRQSQKWIRVSEDSATAQRQKIAGNLANFKALQLQLLTSVEGKTLSLLSDSRKVPAGTAADPQAPILPSDSSPADVNTADSVALSSMTPTAPVSPTPSSIPVSPTTQKSKPVAPGRILTPATTSTTLPPVVQTLPGSQIPAEIAPTTAGGKIILNFKTIQFVQDKTTNKISAVINGTTAKPIPATVVMHLIRHRTQNLTHGNVADGNSPQTALVVEITATPKNPNDYMPAKMIARVDMAELASEKTLSLNYWTGKQIPVTDVYTLGTVPATPAPTGNEGH